MNSGRPRVSIVGAGIIGVSIAFHLSRRGCAVTIVESQPGPAMGVTAHAFGWINMIHGNPEDAAAYALRHAAVDEYARLVAQLPEAFDGARRGSLVWEDTAGKTEALVAAHRAHGASIELVDGPAVGKLEPYLKSPPPVAAHSPGDIALNPARLASSLLETAVASGATTCFGEQVTAIELWGSRVAGIRTANGTIPADVVVVAAGANAKLLTSPLGVDVEIEASPVLLLRYAATQHFINGIVCGPDLEVRQADDRSLVVTEGFTDDPTAVGRRMLETIGAIFDVKGAVSFQSASVGVRPIPAGDMPLAGFAGQVGGLYLAIAHPGVILAPLLGRLAAETILDR